MEQTQQIKQGATSPNGGDKKSTFMPNFLKSLLVGAFLLLFLCSYGFGNQDTAGVTTPEIHTPLKTEVIFGVVGENSAQESEKGGKRHFII